jgi:hypothetical protein
MATGPEHYRAAEDHLDHAAEIETDGHDDSTSAWHQRQAQAHATLALAAAALGLDDSDNWPEVSR